MRKPVHGRGTGGIIRQGIDPKTEEERLRRLELRKQETTFVAVAEDYIERHVLASGQGSVELGARGTLAALHLHELSHDLPASTVEAISNRRLLSLEAQTALALLIGADSVVALTPRQLRAVILD